MASGQKSFKTAGGGIITTSSPRLIASLQAQGASQVATPSTVVQTTTSPSSTLSSPRTFKTSGGGTVTTTSGRIAAQKELEQLRQRQREERTPGQLGVNFSPAPGKLFATEDNLLLESTERGTFRPIGSAARTPETPRGGGQTAQVSFSLPDAPSLRLTTPSQGTVSNFTGKAEGPLDPFGERARLGLLSIRERGRLLERRQQRAIDIGRETFPIDASFNDPVASFGAGSVSRLRDIGFSIAANPLQVVSGPLLIGESLIRDPNRVVTDIINSISKSVRTPSGAGGLASEAALLALPLKVPRIGRSKVNVFTKEVGRVVTPQVKLAEGTSGLVTRFSIKVRGKEFAGASRLITRRIDKDIFSLGEARVAQRRGFIGRRLRGEFSDVREFTVGSIAKDIGKTSKGLDTTIALGRASRRGRVSEVGIRTISKDIRGIQRGVSITKTPGDRGVGVSFIRTDPPGARRVSGGRQITQQRSSSPSATAITKAIAKSIDNTIPKQRARSRPPVISRQRPSQIQITSVSTRQRQSQRKNQRQIISSRVTNDIFNEQRSISRSISGSSNIVTQSQRQTQMSRTNIRPFPPTGFRGRGSGGTGERPPPPRRPRIILPTIDFPEVETQRRGKKKQKGRRTPRVFTGGPSLLGVASGRTVRRQPRVFTGGGIRFPTVKKLKVRRI